MEAASRPIDRGEDKHRQTGVLSHVRRAGRTAISFKLDRDWRLTELSPGAAEYLRVTSEQALGRPIKTVAPSVLGDRFARRLRSACARHRMVRFDYFSETKRPAWLEVACERVDDGLIISLRDVTRRRLLEEDLRLVISSVLQQYDLERRQCSRELHDKVAQGLVLALMELESLGGRKIRAAERKAKLQEIWTVLRGTLVNVKSMSNRLYPPMLDESGIVTSLNWLIREFKAQAGVNARLNVLGTMKRLSHSIELAIFSVVEEAFKLIERNGTGKRIEVELAILGDGVAIVVKAFGGRFESLLDALDELAISNSGIVQLFARIRHLGGAIEAKTAAHSATFSVTLPLRVAHRPRPGLSRTETFRRALRLRRVRQLRLATPDGVSAKRQARV